MSDESKRRRGSKMVQGKSMVFGWKENVELTDEQSGIFSFHRLFNIWCYECNERTKEQTSLGYLANPSLLCKEKRNHANSARLTGEQWRGPRLPKIRGNDTMSDCHPRHWFSVSDCYTFQSVINTPCKRLGDTGLAPPSRFRGFRFRAVTTVETMKQPSRPVPPCKL